MPNSEYVLWFHEIDKDDVDRVGGKGANLGEMTQSGFPVPGGFVVTSAAYKHMIAVNNLEDKIKAILKNLDVENSTALNRASRQVQDLIERSPFPKEIEEPVFKAYDKLGSNPWVAVRSSATAEDLPQASFAGQQETYLNVRGDASLLVHIRKAWASLFEPRAIYYRVQQKFDHFKVALAVPVQKMVQSDISGIMFTINPVTNDKRKIIVEAIWGLGEKIVQGAITPDHYEVNKTTLELTENRTVKQTIEMVRSGEGNIDRKVPKSRQAKRKLTDQQAVEVATLGKKLQQHYFFPQDIEWAIENGKLYVVQTRPITTVEATTHKNTQVKAQAKVITGKLLLQGEPASPGVVTGIVNVLKSAKEIGKIKRGDILVTDMTTPDFVPAMKKAVAIVTNKGGQTSHAAIVSRELGVPCVVGTRLATQILKTGRVITVDGAAGRVYENNLKPSSVKFAPAPKPFYEAGPILKTATKVYVNLGEPDLATEVAKRNVDGVGLLRAEFMIANIGTHPKKLIHDKKSKVFVDSLAEGIGKICAAFGERPVVYRATDFKTNEYSHLKGGEAYEPQEPNPMLGYRGAYRYIHDADVFELELEAIKQVRNKMGYKNLWLMIPFVRNVKELQEVKKIVIASGLPRTQTFKLWMMVEIPVNVILLDQFIDVGIDGISVGTNDLTMLLLGTDRDNETVASDYDERNPAVLWALQHIIRTAHKRGITVSVCGQAPSSHPDVAEFLCKEGVTSVSVTPDVIEKTRQIFSDTEKKLVIHK
ncbi:MAG: Phosphoenolpyruvate synthase [Microgenomates group bacterium GW2011_GWA2_46_7]|nr:MAG: Phosphoenolpyruvate synthase [Microgenomates group bacterium GW2011_GWA2_46_7]